MDSFIFIDDFQKKKDQYDRVCRFFKNPEEYPIPSDLIGERIYSVETEQEVEDGHTEAVIEFARHINFDLMEKIIFDENVTVTAYFGTMKKDFNTSKMYAQDGSKFATIKPTVVRREICKNTWWLDGKRTFRERVDRKQHLSALELLQKFRYYLSYPTGYRDSEAEPARDFIDYEHAPWSLYYPANNLFHFSAAAWDKNIMAERIPVVESPELEI